MEKVLFRHITAVVEYNSWYYLNGFFKQTVRWSVKHLVDNQFWLCKLIHAKRIIAHDFKLERGICSIYNDTISHLSTCVKNCTSAEIHLCIP